MDAGVGVGSPDGLSGILGIFKTVPTAIAFGEISGFAACKLSMDTPNSRAMLLIVSPVCTVYVKGVGLGRGVSAATRPSGVLVGLWVEVTNGINSIVEGAD